MDHGIHRSAGHRGKRGTKTARPVGGVITSTLRNGPIKVKSNRNVHPQPKDGPYIDLLTCYCKRNVNGKT